MIRLSSNTIAPSFTFQYGEIKRDMEDADGYKARKFTFQYGEIKSAPSGVITA